MRILAQQLLCATVALAAVASVFADSPAPPAPLVLESKISLGNVRGRIDHLAVDVVRHRVYVAELGNDTVGVVDLKERKVIRTLGGFREPQGIAYELTTDTVYVADAGDGAVRLFHGADLTSAGTIELGEDADNVRVDANTHRIIVGYGRGALAVIDSVSRKKVADIALKGHPEGFQLEANSPRIFVNVPDAREIAVVDRSRQKQAGSWPTPPDLRANFPLALDESRQQALVMFRHPAKLAAFSMRDGSLLRAIDACGDADDLFIDERRSRVYVSCGEGFVEVFGMQVNGYVRIGRLATSAGSRTARWVPESDRLLLAVRATATEPAALWVFRPK